MTLLLLFLAAAPQPELPKAVKDDLAAVTTPRCEGAKVQQDAHLIRARFAFVKVEQCGDTFRAVYDVQSGERVGFAALFSGVDRSQLKKWLQPPKGAKPECLDALSTMDLAFDVDPKTGDLLAWGNYPHVLAACNALPPMRAKAAALKDHLSEVGQALLSRG